MILVTGATGKVGSEAVRLLTRHQTPVRALVRHPHDATALADLGAEIVEGDFEKPATLDTALTGVSTVILASPAVPVQELNVIDSAVRAGVEHIVKITSKASADSPIARRRRAERAVVRAGRATHHRPAQTSRQHRSAVSGKHRRCWTSAPRTALQPRSRSSKQTGWVRHEALD
jgi:uncharacterized protein YbjT (DUF2867 family)